MLTGSEPGPGQLFTTTREAETLVATRLPLIGNQQAA